jgi:hypothetical protein
MISIQHNPKGPYPTSLKSFKKLKWVHLEFAFQTENKNDSITRLQTPTPIPPPLSLPLPQTLKPNSNYGHPREIDVIHIRHQNSLRSRRKERDSSEQSLEQINLSLNCVSILLPLPLSIWTGGVEEKPKQTHLSFFLGKMLMGWSSVANFIASLKEGTILTCSPELKSSAYSHLLDLEHPLMETNKTKTREK